MIFFSTVYNILESTASAVHDKCGTTDDDLDALFAAIDKEIELDPGNTTY